MSSWWTCRCRWAAVCGCGCGCGPEGGIDWGKEEGSGVAFLTAPCRTGWCRPAAVEGGACGHGAEEARGG